MNIDELTALASVAAVVAEQQVEKPNKEWSDTQITDWLKSQGKSEDYIKSYLRKWTEVKKRKQCC